MGERVVDGRTGKKKYAQKEVFQNHRYCLLCLRSECKWCHVCVFVVYFRSSDTF